MSARDRVTNGGIPLGGEGEGRFEGREREILRAALRGTYDALAEVEPMASGARPASPGAMIRALRSLLEGQAALLEALAGPLDATPTRPKLRPLALDDSDDDLSGLADAVPGARRPARQPAPEPVDAPSSSPATRRRSEPIAAPGSPDQQDERPSLLRAGGRGAESAGRPAGPRRDGPVDPTVAAEAVRAFPLEELNRWLASGTVFQIRGALAFLNAASMGGGAGIDAMRGHIRRMGFQDELGRLEQGDIAGAVILFRRAE